MQIFTNFRRIFAGFLLALLMMWSTVQAGPVKLNDQSNEIKIVQNTNLGFKASYSLSSFNAMDIKTEKGIFSRIIIPSYSKSGEFGNPELPVRSELIEIPVNAQVRVNIINVDIKEYKLKDIGIQYPLIPNQPPVPKTGEIPEFIYNKNVYKINAFSQEELVSVEVLGSMRGVTLGRLDIRPFRYNPVTGMVQIYENLEFEIIFENADLTKTAINKQVYGNQYFSGVFNSLFNYLKPENSGRENFARYPIKFVIVSDPMFQDQLQPLIEWYIMKGFNVIEAYTSDPNVGTTTYQIKAYLQSLYDNATEEDPAPTFVLFVGDIAQVPAWTGEAASHVTDLYYCEYTDDYFPEVFYGRFSATSTDQLQPQIDKTLMYEQYTMPVTSYLDTVVMIAGMDGTFGPVHANGQINYGTENYFNEAHNLYSHTYLYPQSGSNAAQIRQNISDGVTFANYTAHGSPDGWADPSFSVSHIPALQNNGKYGLLVGNCCSSSEYQVGECFGEALLRAVNKGAIGYIGASNSTYWDEDYYFGIGVGTIAADPPSYEETTLGAYDRMFHDHGETFEEWYTSSDQMIFAGNLAVTQGSPGMALYYWEAYCLMGDPSLMVYFSEPPVLSATYDPLLPLGSTSITITTVPYAYVGLSMNGAGLGAALADADGVAVVVLTGTPQPGNADIVITAQNYQPYTGTVLIANPEGPYVMLNQFMINDENGDFDGLVECGENILLDAELKNWGSGNAENTNASISAEDAYVTIIDDTQDYGTIPAQDSIMEMSAYNFQVADSVPDMHVVQFNMNIQDDDRESWGSTFSITLFAPVLQIGNLSISDTEGGNGNGRFDPGETVQIVVECENTGHCDAYEILSVLQSSSPYITIQNSTCTFDTLAWNGLKQAVYSATLAAEIAEGTVIDLNVNLSSDPYATSQLFSLPVGLVMEDFESGGFASFGWVLEGDQPWAITEENVFEGIYSARSGIIGNDQTSVISIEMNVSIDDSISFFRKVSCEDDPYNDNYDWLGFFIDGSEIARWDGEYGWERVAFPVTAGTHIFEWIFTKDYSVASGLDAAFVDNIILPASAPAVGIDDQLPAKNADFLITPNPATDQTELRITLKTASDASITIFDLAGNQVMTLKGLKMNAGNNTLTLQTESLAPGLYFCVLTSAEEKITKKLIIKN